jgi:cell wall-associated NlpC family hydrolase
MTAPDWNAFVGLPVVPMGRDRDGLDCWGLVRLVYAEALGIALPAYAGIHPDTAERAEIDRLMSSPVALKPWREVVLPPQPFDVLVFRIGPWRRHVAVCVDARRMLHAHVGETAVVLRSDARWQTRCTGAFRHEDRA